MIATMHRCTNCRREMSRTASFCGDCGVELADGDHASPGRKQRSRSMKLGTTVYASVCFSSSGLLGLLPWQESLSLPLAIVRILLVCSALVIVIRRRAMLRDMMYDWFVSRAMLEGAFTGAAAKRQAELTSGTIVAQILLGVVYLTASSPLTQIDETLGWLFGILCLVVFLVLGSIAFYNFQCVGEHVINSLLGFAACPNCGRRNVGDVKFCSGCREELEDPMRASVPG